MAPLTREQPPCRERKSAGGRRALALSAAMYARLAHRCYGQPVTPSRLRDGRPRAEKGGGRPVGQPTGGLGRGGATAGAGGGGGGGGGDVVGGGGGAGGGGTPPGLGWWGGGVGG